jgi:hypothetical protein
MLIPFPQSLQMLDPSTNQPPQFFTKLADVFNAPKTKGHGAVFLTQKRRTQATPSHPHP